MLVGSAAYMALQFFPHKDLAYWILELCTETQVSPFLLIRGGCSCCITLQSFPHKELAHSILV